MSACSARPLVLAVVSAAGVIVIERQPTAGAFYPGMPAPCTLIPLPVAMRIGNDAEPPGGLVQTSGQRRTGTCDWLGFTGAGTQVLVELEVDLYPAASGARQAYDSAVAAGSDDQAAAGITASAWADPLLGDPAAGEITTGMPARGQTTVEAWVQSGNAEVWISYYSGSWGPSTAASAEIQTVTSMARHVLAALRKAR